MDWLVEFIFELIDNLTGNKLDYGIRKVAKRLVQNIRNEKLRMLAYCGIWVLFVLLIALALILLGALISLLFK